MTSFDEFWGRSGEGLLTFGAGLYNKNAAQKEAQRRLAAAQGPLYQLAMGAASGMLGQAGTFDPTALATERFNAGEQMLQPVQAKSLADLQRMLYAKGQMGVGNYNPGQEGIQPTGMLMNPQIAAFYAAQNADRTRRMNQSFDQGQAQATNLVNRAGALDTIAGNAQGTGIAAQKTQPSGSTANAMLLQSLLKNPGILKDIGGMFQSGIDWLGGFGGGGGGGFDGTALADQFGGYASW